VSLLTIYIYIYSFNWNGGLGEFFLCSFLRPTRKIIYLCGNFSIDRPTGKYFIYAGIFIDRPTRKLTPLNFSSTDPEKSMITRDFSKRQKSGFYKINSRSPYILNGEDFSSTDPEKSMITRDFFKKAKIRIFC